MGERNLGVGVEGRGVGKDDTINSILVFHCAFHDFLPLLVC